MRAKPVWLIILIVAIAYSWVVAEGDTPTETRTFCAYGKLFIEFKEKYNVWGTLLLDSAGLPIRCNANEHVVPTIKNNSKEKYESV